MLISFHKLTLKKWFFSDQSEMFDNHLLANSLSLALATCCCPWLFHNSLGDSLSKSGCAQPDINSYIFHIYIGDIYRS